MLSSLWKKSKNRVRAQTPEIPAFLSKKKCGRPVELGTVQPGNEEDVIMSLNMDLDIMGEVADMSMVANGAFSASASTRGDSSMHSMSDNGKHFSHNSQLNALESHNPFQSSSPNLNSAHAGVPFQSWNTQIAGDPANSDGSTHADDDGEDYSSVMNKLRIGVDEDEDERHVGLGTSALSIITASTNTYISDSLSSLGLPPSASSPVASIGRSRKPSIPQDKFEAKLRSSFQYDDYPLTGGPSPHRIIADPINVSGLGPLHLRRPLPPNVQELSSRVTIRIYRANNTYHVVSCGFNVTVQTLIPRLNALLHEEEREEHRLYLNERGRGEFQFYLDSQRVDEHINRANPQAHRTTCGYRAS